MTTRRALSILAVTGAAFIAVNICPARSQGLDAPAVPKVTVRSEIARGGDRAFHCGLDFPPSLNWLPFSDCIEAAVHQETQRNTLTDAYLLGLHFTAFIRADRLDIRAVAGADILQREQVLWWNEIKRTRSSLGIDDQEICKALGMIYAAVAPTLVKWQSR